MKKYISITILMIVFVSFNLVFASNALSQTAFTCLEQNSSQESQNILSKVAKDFNSISSLKADFEQRSVLLGFNHSQATE